MRDEGDDVAPTRGSPRGVIRLEPAAAASNGSVNVGVLTVETGGTVRVIDATAFVADGATLTGTFTLTSGWGATVVPQVPPFADPFERYAEGVKLNRMGYFGWSDASEIDRFGNILLSPPGTAFKFR